MPFEDVQMIVIQLLQYASNLLTVVNGPLQKRIEILEKDSQKKLADSLNEKLNQIIFILTSSWNLRLNLGQNYSIETPQVFLSFESNEFIIEFKPESNCFISSSFLSLFVFLNSVGYLR